MVLHVFKSYKELKKYLLFLTPSGRKKKREIKGEKEERFVLGGTESLSQCTVHERHRISSLA